MVKRLVIVVVCVVLAAPAFSQSLGQAETDLATFLGGFGTDILSQLQQSALMSDGVGDASIGDFPHFFFSLGAGAVLSNGIGKIVDDPGAFQVLNVSQIIQLALNTFNNATVTDLYSGSRKFFPFPNGRLAVGVGIAGGVEVIGQVAYWPQALTAALLPGATVDLINAGLRVQKRLLSDEGFLPGLSVGVGYIYSGVTLGYNLSQFGTITLSPATLDFSQSTLSLAAGLQTVGVDLTVSKRLAFFVPYLKLSGWYQWGVYDASVKNLSATISTTSALNPTAHEELSGLDFLVSAGFGLKFGAFGLNIGGSYDPRTNFPALTVGMSGQF